MEEQTTIKENLTKKTNHENTTPRISVLNALAMNTFGNGYSSNELINQFKSILDDNSIYHRHGRNEGTLESSSPIYSKFLSK